MVQTATTDTVPALLTELEDCLATAEELRYRLKVALRSIAVAPAQAAHGRPAPGSPGDKPSRRARDQSSPPAPVAEGPPPIDTSTLKRSGPGLYAWAREYHVLKAITQIGEESGYPSRIIAWSRDQVEAAIDRLQDLAPSA